jgi:hypothetical protein
MGSGGTEVPFNGGRPQLSDVSAVAERECEKLVKTAEQMQTWFADQGDYATALIIQQQIVGCRLMRDAMQAIYTEK